MILCSARQSLATALLGFPSSHTRGVEQFVEEGRSVYLATLTKLHRQPTEYLKGVENFVIRERVRAEFLLQTPLWGTAVKTRKVQYDEEHSLGVRTLPNEFESNPWFPVEFKKGAKYLFVVHQGAPGKIEVIKVFQLDRNVSPTTLKKAIGLAIELTAVDDGEALAKRVDSVAADPKSSEFDLRACIRRIVRSKSERNKQLAGFVKAIPKTQYDRSENLAVYVAELLFLLVLESDRRQNTFDESEDQIAHLCGYVKSSEGRIRFLNSFNYAVKVRKVTWSKKGSLQKVFEGWKEGADDVAPLLKKIMDGASPR